MQYDRDNNGVIDAREFEFTREQKHEAWHNSDNLVESDAFVTAPEVENSEKGPAGGKGGKGRAGGKGGKGHVSHKPKASTFVPIRKKPSRKKPSPGDAEFEATPCALCTAAEQASVKTPVDGIEPCPIGSTAPEVAKQKRIIGDMYMNLFM